MSDSNSYPDIAAERKRFADLLKAGYEKLEAEDYEGALLEFDSAQLFDTTGNFANLLAAACLVQLNRTDEADLRLANTDSIPQGPIVHILQSQIFAAREQYGEAEHALWQAVAESPTDATARVELGRFFLSQNRVGEANRQFEQAMEMNPSNPEAHLLLGLSYIVSQEFAKATTFIEKAVELEPLNDRALALYGHLLIIRAFKLFQTPPKLAGYQKALEVFKRALDLNPSNEFAIEQLREAEAAITRINTPTGPPTGFDSWREPFRWLLLFTGMIVLFIGYFALLVWLDESFGSAGFWGGIIFASVFYLAAFCLALYLKKDYAALPPSILKLYERGSKPANKHRSAPK